MFVPLLLLLLLLGCGGPLPAHAAVSASTSSGGGASGIKALTDRIKTVVILMEENRSFDHYMGTQTSTKHGGNASYCNPVNASDPASQRVCMRPGAPYVNFCDPDHSYPATTYKIFGPQAYAAGNLTKPTMSGFVEFERDVQHHMNPKLQYCGVMDQFTPEQLPVLTALAENFVYFDMFFCSVPGPTWPNRLFFLSGTSAGLTETIPWYHLRVGDLFPQRTIFDQVKEAGGTAKYVYDDAPWELFLESLAHSPEITVSMDDFYRDAREGTLPNFVFINPRAGVNLTSGLGSNDLHPDHDVALGEKLYKDIYEALRASPQWNETLFVLTFDEHGGLADHVTPPKHVPPPGDGEASYPDSFGFDRAGIRIPTLLISPWLQKGHVETHPPPRQRPTPSSIYELTSIMATVRKLLPFMNNTPPLTKRDAWAATFEHLFAELDAPRTDCPATLPAAPPPSAELLGREQHQPVNGLQRAIMGVHAHLAGVEYPHHVARQGEVGEWLRHHHGVHRARTTAWKAAKAGGAAAAAAAVPELRLTGKGGYYTATFFVAMNATARPGVHTVSAAALNETWCWDGGNMTALSIVRVSPCLPSRDPVFNRDAAQQWVVLADHTIRPAADQGLCVTSAVTRGSDRLHLAPCVGNGHADHVAQSFAWMTDAPGPAGGPVVFNYGDAYLQIVLTPRGDDQQ